MQAKLVSELWIEQTVCAVHSPLSQFPISHGLFLLQYDWLWRSSNTVSTADS